MKTLRFWRSLSLFALLPLVGAHAANPPAESSELARARARLLDLYNRKVDDDDNSVQSTKKEIARLEYIAAHTPANADDSAPLISVDFPGGPASALIAAADKNSVNGFNVVGEKADLAIEVPPISIRNADVKSFAAAVDSLLQPRGYALQQSSGSAAGHSPVFILRKLSAVELANQAWNRTGQFQSFQLGNYLGEQTVDDIVGAIRTAWELDPSHNSAALRLKFHPPTGILLVSGPPDGIMLVQTVLRELRRNPQSSSPVKAATTEAHDDPAAVKTINPKK